MAKKEISKKKADSYADTFNKFKMAKSNKDRESALTELKEMLPELLKQAAANFKAKTAKDEKSKSK